jgi:hypothetical protein
MPFSTIAAAAGVVPAADTRSEMIAHDVAGFRGLPGPGNVGGAAASGIASGAGVGAMTFIGETGTGC